MSSSSENDKAKREAGEILNRIDAKEKVSKEYGDDEKPQSILDKVKGVVLMAQRFNKLWDGAQDLYERVKPVAQIIAAPPLWAFDNIKEIFTYNAFKHDGQGRPMLDAQGDMIFDPMRLTRAFTTAVILGNMAAIGAAGILFHTTNETVYSYVTNKQMKVPGELYEVTGAESLPASTELDNGMYYHVRDSIYYPAMWRPEEDVYALIPQGNAVCKWDTYGIYMKEMKWLHKQVEFYKSIYDTSCYPLSDVMIESIARDGILPQDMFNQMMNGRTSVISQNAMPPADAIAQAPTQSQPVPEFTP
jgi:hypothetical protein